MLDALGRPRPTTNQPGQDEPPSGLDRARWNALADAVLVADAEARYLDANRAALQLLGCSLSELRAMTVGDVVAHGADWTKTEYEKFMRDGYWEGRLAIRPKRGPLVVVEARATVLRLGNRTEFLSVLRERWIPAVRAEPPPGAAESPSRVASLTRRERDVLALVAVGCSSPQVSTRLGISARTVDTHRHRIMRKLGVQSIAALTRFALENGLVNDG